MPVTVTGISLPSTELRDFLRRVARSRQARLGGRSSVSSILVQLVELHRSELQAELDGGESQGAAAHQGEAA